MIENFQVNSNNELTVNTNGGTLTVVGTTTSPANSVTVNSTSASIYGDATFAAPGLALTTTYTATASDHYGRSATNAVTVSLSTNITYQYDGNGNLTNDGTRSLVYDDENELIQVSVSNQWLSQFTYDGKMRRRIRQEFTLQGTNWVQTNAVYYVYDGNLVIQERDLNNLPTTTYTRGKDLSGSLDGAGGIGGLLSMTLNTEPGPLSSNSVFYHCDGNGNVTMLINSYQAIVAKYLYDAFGNTLAKSGSLADANPYRFSSKEWHQNSGLVYYLYRYYDPNLQRWPNRDPMEEDGGLNLYTFAANDSVNHMDPYGLQIDGIATPGITTVLMTPEELAAAQAAAARAAARLAAAAAAAASTSFCQAPKDPCKGLRDQYNAHLKKLQDYIKDPEGHDNLGTLQNNPGLRDKLIDGRIRALQRQINNFKKQLDACEKANGM